jgi:imidazolonepropionase-like amidohydrolase
MRRFSLLIIPFLLMGFLAAVSAQDRATAVPAPDTLTLLKPQRVFDGDASHDGWGVLVRGARIEAAGPLAGLAAAGAMTIDLPGTTVLPGLIEAHSHVLLHPYDETSWNDQVAHETLALRVARATVSLRATLEAGFTTIRDLGTEGAGYADVGLKQAVQRGIIPGPRMLVATRAIVATGSYGPKGYPAEWLVPQGAEEADGNDLIRVVRDQAGKGADWIKIYGDYRAGPRGEAVPTFTQDEMNLIVSTARSLGRPVSVHASTPEGMRRAILAGAETIEHGDGGTPEIFQLMAERKVALSPTVAAGDASAQYNGWKKGSGPEPANIRRKRESFKLALAAGVTIASGSDVGVLRHGDRRCSACRHFGRRAGASSRGRDRPCRRRAVRRPDCGRRRSGHRHQRVAQDPPGDEERRPHTLNRTSLTYHGATTTRSSPTWAISRAIWMADLPSGPSSCRTAAEPGLLPAVGGQASGSGLRAPGSGLWAWALGFGLQPRGAGASDRLRHEGTRGRTWPRILNSEFSIPPSVYLRRCRRLPRLYLSAGAVLGAT